MNSKDIVSTFGSFLGMVKSQQEEIDLLRAENKRLSTRVDALEDAMNPQDVADVDAMLSASEEE